MAIAREGLPEEIPNARIEANGSNAQTFPSAPIPLSSTIKEQDSKPRKRHRAQTTSAGQTSTRTAKASRSSTAHSAASTGRASALACAASRKGRRTSGRSRVRLCRLGRFLAFRVTDCEFSEFDNEIRQEFRARKRTKTSLPCVSPGQSLPTISAKRVSGA